MNIRHLATAVLFTLPFADPALAGHDGETTYVRGHRDAVVAVSSHAQRARGPQYDYARVLSAKPIVRYVTVRTPVRECYRDVEYYTVERRRPGGGGTLVGAIVGGVIGHQFGSGRGNDAATVAGTLIGAAVGSESARQKHARYGGYETVRHSRPVERCSTRVAEREERRIDGYRVIYSYNGRKYATDMPYDPGRELRVRVDIRPAG